jgi:hypothetical protein
MTESDKATLASFASLVVNDRMSVAKALETAYLLGELEGQLKVARITENAMQELLKVAA